MDAYVFSSLAAAQACQTAVDAAQGFPRAGVNVGGGAHVEPPFVTQTYQTVIQHPTQALWAYPSDTVTTPVLSVGPTAVTLPAPTSLDATWTPGAAAI
jgi:hypothetical protein